MKTSPFVLLLALAATVATSRAAIVYSGLQNIAIGTTFDSVYVNVDAATSSSTQSPGWDVDAFFGGQGIGNSASFQPGRQTVAVDAPILRLEPGQTVDGSLNYFTAEAGSSTHIGSGVSQFQSGTEGYFGFKLTIDNGDGPYYGWMRVNLSNTGTPGSIIDWAYETSGAPISVGAVPEASTAILGGLAGLALATRRRRN